MTDAPMLETAKARFFLYAGIFLAFVGFAGNDLEIEPFHTLFYIFAWWAYILLADAAVYRLKGNSLLVSRFEEFCYLAPWSCFVWFLFELANLRLHNWQYTCVPSGRSLRWSGYFLAYATVLPGIFVTTELLGSARLFDKFEIRPLSITPRLIRALYAAGAAFLILPLAFPKYFFAFIWAAFSLLLEPLNYRLGLGSLLRDLETGRPGKLFRLLTAGAVCGFLWEFWNYKAGARWVYTVPLVGNLKLFEMPVAGYLGFPLFAVECYAIYNLISYLRRGKTWEEDSQEPVPGLAPSPRLLIAAGLILAAVCALTPALIDTHTIRLFIASL